MIFGNGRVYHSVRDCIAVPVELHETKCGLLPYNYALKPLLMIHSVMVSCFVSQNLKLT